MPRKTLIQHRRDTALNWTVANPALASGEIGVETDTNKFKLGDGSTAWTGLAYQGATSGPSALEDLSDVVITSVSNGDILTYDSATGKWVNTTPEAAASISFTGSYSGTTWNVVHNLGYRPAVTTTDNALTPNVVEGTISHIDENSLTVTFTANIGGTVYLS